MKIFKNYVYINGVNDNGMQVLMPNAEVDHSATTTQPDSDDKNIYNYFVYEGLPGDQSKNAPAFITEKPEEPNFEEKLPEEPQVSSIFSKTIQMWDWVWRPFLLRKLLEIILYCISLNTRLDLH